MGRGRGRGVEANGSTSAAAASPRPTASSIATPASEVGDVFARVSAEIDRQVEERVASLLAPTLDDLLSWHGRSYQGGVSKDTTRPADDLLEAAIAAAAGDERSRRLALELLDRAEQHQRAYVLRLEAAIAEPRRQASHLMWKAASSKSTDAAEHERLRHQAESLLGQIADNRSLLTDPERREELASRRSGQRDALGLSKRVKERVNLLLADSLGADDHARARGLHARYRDLFGGAAEDGPPTDQELEISGRLQRALAAIGRPATVDWTAGLRTPPARLENLLRHRLGGDGVEEVTLGGDGLYSSQAPAELEEIPAAESASEVLARARAMARIPARFRRSKSSVRLISDDDKPERVELIVPTSAEGLKDMLRHARASGYLENLAVKSEAVTSRGGKRMVSLEVSIATSLPDQDVVLTSRLQLGETRLTNPDSQTEWLMSEVAPELGLEQMVADAQFQTGDDPHLGRSPLIRDFSLPLRNAKRSRDLAAMIGRDRCNHSGARWLPAAQRATGASSPTADTARLNCPDCLRTRVAAEPLHRFPADHPALEGVAEEDYLARERFYSELRGDRRPITSIAQLRERDGIAELNPAAYAVGMTAAPRPPSIASAMNRR